MTGTAEEISHLNKKQRIKNTLLRVFAALGITMLLSQINLEYIESYLYDLRVRSAFSNSTSGHIDLIYITPQTVQVSNGFPDSRKQNALILKLIEAGAKAVVVDYNLHETPGTTGDKDLLEDTIVQHPQIFIAGRSTPLKGEEKELQLKEPFERVYLSPSPKTADALNFAKDGVTRRILLTYQGQPMLPVRLAALYNPTVNDINAIRSRFVFYDTDQTYVDFTPPKSYPSFSFEDVASANFSAERFKDKIVFIGTNLSISEDDYILSPYGREVSSMTRIEFQANAVDTLIKNSAPLKVPVYFNWLFVFLAALLTLNVVLTMKPTKGLLILGMTIGGFALICGMAYWFFRLWLPMAVPLLTIFLCYYFFIPYRLIIESRKSWEYYQKNKLLSQVEELKTNFISMMSHDLKTPIARIQGMTDMILAGSNPLNPQQREAVDTIKHSSDDLLKFINAILSYGKIESQGVQLNLQSKDLNNLLQEVIRKHEFLAKVKRIQIVPELEPMFPVPVDAELMKQVFSNLVENAIKYSPEDTKIMVSSEETDSTVVVQVVDQGPGIPADELSNIFMKFFRSKNAKSSPIKGSGLGLYLAKYFTELHRGTIIVESSHGQGSTFTVELPMEQGGKHA